MHILRQGGVKGAATEIGLAICSLGSCRSTSELRLRSSRDEWRWARSARVWGERLVVDRRQARRYRAPASSMFL